MNQIQYVSFDTDVQEWFMMKAGEKGHMNNWFNGAGSLKQIFASNDTFIVSDEYIVQGTTVFNGCDNLFGGNGTRYTNREADDLTYLKVDTATRDPKTGTNVYGYLTNTEIKVKYDLNGGTVPDGKQVLLDAQSVSGRGYFTVGGIDNSFINSADIVAPDGKQFKAWVIKGLEGQEYQNGDSVSAVLATEGTVALTAVYEDIPVVEVDAPTWKQDIVYDGNAHNITVNPDTYWNNFNASAMKISGETEETNPGAYKATFSLENGYVWKGTLSPDPIDVQ